jgi:teichuronic acid biosynthesis glycosyltransferase TuaC
MRLLFLSETFPDALHPATGTYNLALCRELAREHEVRVISPRSWLDVVRGRRFEAGNTVRESGLKVLYPTRWYTPGFAQSMYGGQMWWSIGSALRTLTRNWKPDAVLSYWAHPDGECGLRAGRMFHAPSAVIVGGSDVLLLPKDPVRGTCVRRVLNESDTVITVSEGLRQACLEQGVPATRVRTIRQGIDPQVFHAGDQTEARTRLGLSVPASETLAVWVGRMVGLKRVDVLIQACRLLKERGQRVRVCLLGDGPCRAAWEQLAASVGITDPPTSPCCAASRKGCRMCCASRWPAGHLSSRPTSAASAKSPSHSLRSWSR